MATKFGATSELYRTQTILRRSQKILPVLPGGIRLSSTSNASKMVSKMWYWLRERRTVLLQWITESIKFAEFRELILRKLSGLQNSMNWDWRRFMSATTVIKLGNVQRKRWHQESGSNVAGKLPSLISWLQLRKGTNDPERTLTSGSRTAGLLKDSNS